MVDVVRSSLLRDKASILIDFVAIAVDGTYTKLCVSIILLITLASMSVYKYDTKNTGTSHIHNHIVHYFFTSLSCKLKLQHAGAAQRIENECKFCIIFFDG